MLDPEINKALVIPKRNRNRRATHHRPNYVEWLIGCLALVILAGAGVVVYRHLRVTGTGAPETAQTAHQQPAAADAYAGWKTYTSSLGDFSVRYPASWELSGFRGVNSVAGSDMNGYENQIRLQSKPSTRINDFGIDINVSTGTYSTPYNTYGNGTVTKLSNGITLWQEKEQENYAAGPATDNCPALQIGTDATFSQVLRSGEYLSFYGSFCWAQNRTTDQTYAQQVASPEWATAVAIVHSIQLN